MFLLIILIYLATSIGKRSKCAMANSIGRCDKCPAITKYNFFDYLYKSNDEFTTATIKSRISPDEH